MIGNKYGSLELLRELRQTELAGFLFEEDGKESITENKNEKLLKAFLDFVEFQFDNEIIEKINFSINEKIKEEEREKNREDVKKFTVPNYGVGYVDADYKWLTSDNMLLIDYNWLALLIKPMLSYLKLSGLNYDNASDVSKKEKDIFNLMIYGMARYIRSFCPERKIGIYLKDPNFWSVSVSDYTIAYSIYQELILAFDAVYIKREYPGATNSLFERIFQILDIKAKNWYFLNSETNLELIGANALNDEELKKLNLSPKQEKEQIIFNLWFAIKDTFQKHNPSYSDFEFTSLYLKLMEVKDTISEYIYTRITKGFSEIEKLSMQKNLYKELLYSEYSLIAKEYLNYLEELNNKPEEYMDLILKKNQLVLVNKLSGSVDQLLTEEIDQLNSKINNYTFTSYGVNLFSFGKFISRVITIKDEDKKYFIDPNTKDKDSKLIEEAIKNFDRLYRNRILGQDHIIQPIWSNLKKWYIGIRSKKPVGSFLLCGPTGVGKTETAKFLSEELGTFDNLITLDMSEYQSEIDKTKIIGVAPGYQGYDQGAGILDKVAASPRSVILFDEIEKAHPLIFDLLLQLLDEGRLTDHKGNEVSFKECLIICTTNAHYGDIEHLGSNVRSDIINILSMSFRKEFLARFTDILKFNNLSMEVMELIFDKKLAEEIKDISDNFQQEIIIIEDENYYQKKTRLVGSMDYSLGARELGRLINEEIIAPLIELIIDLGSEIEGKKFYFDTLGTLKIKEK